MRTFYFAHCRLLHLSPATYSQRRLYVETDPGRTVETIPGKTYPDGKGKATGTSTKSG